MAEAFDNVGQWLIQLPLLAQISVLCVVLLLVGGVVAFALVGAVDIVGGRMRRVSRLSRDRRQARREA